MGERVATMLAEVACPRCQYSLRRQPIVREPVYGHHAIRCPECAELVVVDRDSVAKVGEWAAVRTAGWYLLSSALVVFLLSRGTGFSHGSIGFGTRPYARILAQLHAPEPGIGSPYGPSNPNDELEVVSAAWFDGVDHASLLKQYGGWLHLIEWGAVVTQWLRGFVFLLLATVGLAILTCNSPRFVRVVWLCIAAFIVLDALTGLRPFNTPIPRPSWASVSVFTPELVERESRLIDAIVLLLMLGVLWFITKPLARWVVRRLVKPEALGEYSRLWPEGRPPKALPTWAAKQPNDVTMPVL